MPDVMHAMQVVQDVYVTVLSAVMSVAVVARIGVFCYWWVVGSWHKERDVVLAKMPKKDTPATLAD